MSVDDNSVFCNDSDSDSVDLNILSSSTSSENKMVLQTLDYTAKPIDNSSLIDSAQSIPVQPKITLVTMNGNDVIQDLELKQTDHESDILTDFSDDDLNKRRKQNLQKIEKSVNDTDNSGKIIQDTVI